MTRERPPGVARFATTRIRCCGLLTAGLTAALLTGCSGAATHSTPVTSAPARASSAHASSPAALPSNSAPPAPVLTPPAPGIPPLPALTPAPGSPADVVQIQKCWTNATSSRSGPMLIKARSSDPRARLFAFLPDGTFLAELQNGGGNKYGGNVINNTPTDPGSCVVRSSAGGSATAPTAPFQAEN